GLAMAAVRSLGMAALLVAAYYLVPIQSHPHQSIVLRLGVALAIFVAVLANEVRSIVNHRQPSLRAGVSMATVIPLFLVLFAWIYLTLAHSNPRAFNTGLNRTEGLYLAVTIFSTVGFGDIVPKVDAARVVVMVQMMADLVLIAVVVRLLFAAASRGAPSERERTP
ncbi:MAG: two pore domain potassium channel family protein, partial [Acidimicrobiales bacterium]|nr:two pore domain potassium channel family protein [Acidimicrobiales bacterium]